MKLHTPTPWTRTDNYSDLVGSNGKPIVFGGGGIAFGGGEPERYANTAFMECACNNIERLEKVNEALVRALKGAKVYYGTRQRDRQGDMLMEEIEAAIKLAKEPA